MSIHTPITAARPDIEAIYEQHDARQSALMQNFAEAHEDVVHGEYFTGRGTICFRIIRVINGDEGEGVGSTPEIAYRNAKRALEQSNAALSYLVRDYADMLDKGQGKYVREVR